MTGDKHASAPDKGDRVPSAELGPDHGSAALKRVLSKEVPATVETILRAISLLRLNHAAQLEILADALRIAITYPQDANKEILNKIVQLAYKRIAAIRKEEEQ